MSQSTKAEIDKDQYKEIQTVIEQNPTITGFDLYYLGFLSYYASQLSLKSTFTHVRNINNLHVDDLITSEEKIEFLLRIVSKLVDFNVIKPVTMTSEDTDVKAETKRILGDYFSQILKLIPKYGNISRFELFYLGRFHAICPNYKIAELFHHINNINMLVYGDLIDEDIQVDFLLKILNKKIKTHQGKETTLNIPTDQDIDKKEGSVPNVFLIKNEDAESKADKTDKSPSPLFVKKEDSGTKQNPPASKPAEKSSKTTSEKSKESSRNAATKENQSTSSKETESKSRGRKSKGDFDQDRESDNLNEKQSRSKTPLDSAEHSKGLSNQEPWRKNSPVDKVTTKTSSSGKQPEGNNKFKFSTEKPAKDNSRIPPRSPNNNYQVAGDSLLSLAAENKRLSNIRKGVSLAGAYLMKEDSNSNNKTTKTPTIRSGSVSKENSRRIEEERFPGSDSGENSKSNESTSVESSEVKTAKQVGKSKVLTNVAVTSTVSIASVGGGADSMNIENNRTFHGIGGGEHYGEESSPKKKVQTKPKLTRVEELLRRVRAEDSEDTVVEKEGRRGPKASEMLPPASLRESQASVASERPLLVDWKKKNVKKLREERSESEQEEEVEKSGSEEESEEEDKAVELGKRGKKVLKGTEETKKKLKNDKNMQRDPNKDEIESYEEKRKRLEKGGRMVEETRKGYRKVVEEDEENEESENSQETRPSLKQIKNSQKSKGKQEGTPVKKSARMKKVPEKRARTRSPSSDRESME